MKVCRALVLLSLLGASDAKTDGQALTPPMSWRNWNYFQGNITQDIMEAQMKAMVVRERWVWGMTGVQSLLDVGYNHAGLDDNWQACGQGITNTSFHDVDGNPIVNTDRFPDMKSMVDFGHNLGLKVGWYMNNCICGENGLSQEQIKTDTDGNLRAIRKYGYDGVKMDGCGPGRDMTYFSGSIDNETAAGAQEVLIENCHYNKVTSPDDHQPHDYKDRIFPYWKNNITGGELVCPEHFFRSSNDIFNFWSSWMNNLMSTVDYADIEHPISTPGCWSYPDEMMIGVFANPYAPDQGPALSKTEWRSHFGAWCIVSSPLVLGFDLTNQTVLDEVWDIITNIEAIAINQQWAGHPGRFINTTGTVTRHQHLESSILLGIKGEKIKDQRNKYSNNNNEQHEQDLDFTVTGVQFWVKKQPNDALAVFVLNTDDTKVQDDILLTFSDLGLDTSKSAYTVRDIWLHKDVDTVKQGTTTYSVLGLDGHDSHFLLFTPISELF